MRKNNNSRMGFFLSFCQQHQIWLNHTLIFHTTKKLLFSPYRLHNLNGLAADKCTGDGRACLILWCFHCGKNSMLMHSGRLNNNQGALFANAPWVKKLMLTEDRWRFWAAKNANYSDNYSVCVYVCVVVCCGLLIIIISLISLAATVGQTLIKCISLCLL